MPGVFGRRGVSAICTPAVFRARASIALAQNGRFVPVSAVGEVGANHDPSLDRETTES